MKQFVVIVLFFMPLTFLVLSDNDLILHGEDRFWTDVYSKKDDSEVASSTSLVVATTTASTTPPMSHVKTPEHVKALYMSSWVAGTPSIRYRG